MSKRRILITGIGVVAPNVIGKEEFWQSLKEGRSGIKTITSFDSRLFKTHLSGEVSDFDVEKFLGSKGLRNLDRSTKFLCSAAKMALDDAGISLKNLPRRKLGILIGTTTGEKPLEELIQAWVKGGLKDVDRQRIMQASVNNISANVALQFKAQGENYLFPTACAAGNYSIGYGFDLIRNGSLNYVLAGGSDAFSHVAFAGFQRIYAMSPDKCQPFDKNRKGMMLGEGSGVLLLERLDLALQTAPDPNGIARAMEKALAGSDLTYREVDYISAHGTGTPLNDKAECEAIKKVFKERHREVMVSSIKSMLGHPMGAASAIEAIVCCLAVKENLVPPTINFETPDPECDIDCVPNKAREREVRVALNNGFAFGGNNASVVIKKYEG